VARLGGAMEKGVASTCGPSRRVHCWRVAGQAVVSVVSGHGMRRAGRRTPPGGIKHISPYQGMHEDEAL